MCWYRTRIVIVNMNLTFFGYYCYCYLTKAQRQPTIYGIIVYNFVCSQGSGNSLWAALRVIIPCTQIARGLPWVTSRFPKISWITYMRITKRLWSTVVHVGRQKKTKAYGQLHCLVAAGVWTSKSHSYGCVPLLFKAFMYYPTICKQLCKR